MRWAASLVLALLLAVTGVVWGDWFQRQDDLAREAYRSGDYATAASTFEDPYRRGVALYRAGQYEEAAHAFASVTREAVKLDAKYNFGNAQFQLQRFDAAIQAYEEVLKADPSREDAGRNLALARSLTGVKETEKDAPPPKPETKQPAPEQDPETQTMQAPESHSSEQREQQAQQPQSQQQQSQQQGGAQPSAESAQAQSSAGQNTSSTGDSSDAASDRSDSKAGERSRAADADDTAQTEKAGDQQDKAGGQSSGKPESSDASRQRTESAEQRGQARERQSREAESAKFSHDERAGESQAEPQRKAGASESEPRRQDGTAAHEAAEPRPDAPLRKPEGTEGRASGGERDRQQSGAGREMPREVLEAAGRHQAERESGQHAGEARQASPSSPPRSAAASPEAPGTSSAAVKEFTQIPGEKGGGADRSEATSAGEQPLPASNPALIELQLSQVEANPTALLKRQFQWEEQRLLREQGGYFFESRPW